MTNEAALEPDLPIIDPHHHLWNRRPAPPRDMPVEHRFQEIVRDYPRYLLDELVEDTQGAGHKVIATVFVECRAMYSVDADEALAPVGEVEFVNGVAAMSASGGYGDFRACAGIVGRADLMLGDGVAPVLEALVAASPRFRGIRNSASWDADPAVLGPLNRTSAGLYLDPTFREGFARLADHGLSFDAWLLEPQLPDLIDLARAFPEQPIVLDHVGTPLGIASYRGRRQERFEGWRENVRALAACPNVSVKLGGLPMPFNGFELDETPPQSSEQWAEAWRPYIETCIEAFGPERAMFESNFPVDKLNCPYDVLWNAFKRITEKASPDEKAFLYAGTAIRVYRLDLERQAALS